MTIADLQPLFDALKDVKNPFTILALAAFVGGLVRVLKTKPVGDFLDSLPPAWLKAIPKTSLPYVAVGIAIVIASLDARLNAHLPWGQALLTGALGGILSGGTAIGGHETLAKAISLFLKHDGPMPMPPAPPQNPPSTGGFSAYSFRRNVLGPAFLALCLGGTPLLVSEATAGCGLLTPAEKQAGGAIVNVACQEVIAFEGLPNEQALCALPGDLLALGDAVRAQRADAGPPLSAKGGRCKIIPSTTVCATDPELATAIMTRRASVDGGTR